jgi:hypothetical protein
MVPTRKLILPAILLSLAVCKKDPQKEEGLGVSPEKLEARFELLPSARGETIEFREDGFVEYTSDLASEKGLYVLGEQSLRFRFESGAYGVFLRDSYHPPEWRGLFQDEVRILRRVSGAKNLDR